MSNISKIEWTEKTWNPVTGCSKVSLGCQNCYAEKMALWLKNMNNEKYKNGFDITLHPKDLLIPLKWKKPSIIFVNSMSDLFHKNIPFDYIKEVFKIMNKANWHIFQILTKRAEYLSEVCNKLNWTDNIWMGVTVETQKYIERINHLVKTPAKIKFLSLEPLLSEINYLPLKNIDWVIVGGESGNNARPMKKEWVIKIKDICQKEKTPFFFKQWGGKNKKAAGRMLEGKIWSESPDISTSQQLTFV